MLIESIKKFIYNLFVLNYIITFICLIKSFFIHYVRSIIHILFYLNAIISTQLLYAFNNYSKLEALKFLPFNEFAIRFIIF